MELATFSPLELPIPQGFLIFNGVSGPHKPILVNGIWKDKEQSGIYRSIEKIDVIHWDTMYAEAHLRNQKKELFFLFERRKNLCKKNFVGFCCDVGERERDYSAVASTRESGAADFPPIPIVSPWLWWTINITPSNELPKEKDHIDFFFFGWMVEKNLSD